MVEDRLPGVKSREVHEAPAAVVLHAAHRELQKLVTARDLDRVARFVSLQYADLVYNGMWFTPLRGALDAFVEKVQERVTGAVRLKLFKGSCRIVGRRAPFALSGQALATCAAGARLDQPAAEAFAEALTTPS
jgi:argininosuccinate synthase